MKLYYRTVNGIPMDNTCTDALIGAMKKKFEIHTFEVVSEIPKDNDTIVVGSVEDIQEYFNKKFSPIDDAILLKYKKREVRIGKKPDINIFPIFVKPNNDIKNFTGFVATSESDLAFIDDEVELQLQEVVDFESEYRVYISNCRIIGVKHYLGDPFLTLDENFVREAFRDSIKFKENSYVLDFGIFNNETYLIETNDAWAIGNYGLAPETYFHFLLERWIQLKS